MAAASPARQDSRRPTRLGRRRRGRLALAVAAGILASPALGPLAAATIPSLTLDLRDRATGGKDVYVSRVGDIVFLDLYAIVQGADSDPTNDGISILVNGFKSSAGGILGNLQGIIAPAPYNAAGSSAGTQNDLDGDGDLDIGPMNVNATDADDFYAARALPTEAYYQPIGGYHIGQVRFTVGALSDEPATVNAFKRNDPLGTVVWLDGNAAGSGQSAAHIDPSRVFSGLDVTIRRQVIVDPVGSQYLSGTVNRHLTVSNDVRATPNTTLTLALGADVLPGGTLEPGNGKLNFEVNDVASGNAGGSLVASATAIATTADGVFTHSAGTSKLGNVGIGYAGGRHGTLNISGGTVNAYAVGVGVGPGAGSLNVTNGASTFTSLEVQSGSSAGVGGGTLNVFGNATVNGGATFTQSGGTTTVSQTIQLGDMYSAAPGLLRIQSGTLNAATAFVGGSWYNNAGATGRVEQTGGTFKPTSLRLGGAENLTTYDLSDGRLEPSSMSLNDSVLFSQTGGELAGGLIFSILDGFGSTQYHLAGGVIDRPHLRNNRTNADPVAGSNRTGGFVQSGGQFAVDEYSIGIEGISQHVAGTATVRERLTLEGKIDFADTAFTLNIGSHAIGNFHSGQILNASNATLSGGVGSLMSFASQAQIDQVGTVQTQGLIHIAGQPLAIPQNQSIGGSGVIEGNVTNSGTIRPGHSPGHIEIDGNFVQANVGALEMEIAGTGPDDFDLLTVSGSATLDGELDLALLDGFVPGPGDAFKILAAASLSGAFDNVIGGEIQFPGGTFNVQYSPTGVTLTNFQAVPEPASLGLVGAGLAATSLRRRRARPC